MKRALFGIVVVLLLASAVADARAPRRLKVGILIGVQRVTLFSSRPMTVVDKTTHRVIARVKEVTFVASSNRIKVGKHLYGRKIAIYPPRGKYISVRFYTGRIKARPYRGYFLVGMYEGKLVLINVVDLEHYLYGVLGMEINPKWNIEAIKAQAVVARTYALYSRGSYRKAGFDIVGSTRFQAYRGVAAERYIIRKAVNETRGEILVYHGKPIAAFYHSDSGGATSSSKSVWGKYYPYLKSVKAKFEENPPYHNWQCQLSIGDFRKRLLKKYSDVGDIEYVKVAKRDKGGRVLSVEVKHTHGILRLKGTQMRAILGYKNLRSTKFKILFPTTFVASTQQGSLTAKKLTFMQLLKLKHFTTEQLLYFLKHPEARKKAVEEYSKQCSDVQKEQVYSYKSAKTVSQVVGGSVIRFVGKGWGHGVGMSQWGAKAMAEHGYTYKQILLYYYPGVKLVKLY